MPKKSSVQLLRQWCFVQNISSTPWAVLQNKQLLINLTPKTHPWERIFFFSDCFGSICDLFKYFTVCKWSKNEVDPWVILCSESIHPTEVLFVILWQFINSASDHLLSYHSTKQSDVFVHLLSAFSISFFFPPSSTGGSSLHFHDNKIFGLLFTTGEIFIFAASVSFFRPVLSFPISTAQTVKMFWCFHWKSPSLFV